MGLWITGSCRARWYMLLLLSSTFSFAAQAASDAVSAAKPLPDIPSLMLAVQANQHAEEARQKDYLYHSVQVLRQSDGHGGVKKSETTEYDVFWLDGVPVRRLTRRNGKDLSPDEAAKESSRLDKEAEKARERRDRADAAGKETDPRGNDIVPVSRLLELGRFTNPRRMEMDGRPTIAVDFAGDPAAHTRNRFEAVIRDMQGTAYIDEQDKVLRRADGEFVHAFKIGGGLVVNIGQGTRFRIDQRKINGEVWLPNRVEARGSVRALLLYHFDGSLNIVNSGFRKFRATSTILPGVGKVEGQPGDASSPPKH